MAKLEEKETIDAVTWTETGHIHVRKALIILRDGVEVSRTFHRSIIEPGTDVRNENPAIRKMAELWTPKLVEDFAKEKSKPPKNPQAKP